MTKTREISDVLTGVSFTGDVTFGDNNKAIFGAGSDLQIYHDGSDSYINDSGAGDLKLGGNQLQLNNAAQTKNYIYAVDGAQVELKYNNALKLATTSTGIDVTGTVEADAMTVNGNTVWNAGNDGSGSGLDADLLDGYHASTTRNAANTIPIRDANGYLQLGWINTTSGATGSTINKIYASNDDYIRYVTPATLISQLGLWTSSNDGSGSGLDADLLDGVQGANYLRNDATNANATFTDITLDDQIISSGDTDTYMQFHAADEWRVVTGGGERLEVNNSGVNVTGAIVASGNVTAFSDERLKDNIETLDGSKVYEMRGVSFTKDGEASSGVIAQEIQKVAPELVNDSNEYLSVAYGNLVGYLIEGMKQLKQEVVELKAEVEQLKSEK